MCGFVYVLVMLYFGSFRIDSEMEGEWSFYLFLKR